MWTKESFTKMVEKEEIKLTGEKTKPLSISSAVGSRYWYWLPREDIIKKKINSMLIDGVIKNQN